jgi:dihydrolipoamide dehydrogenase
LKNEDDRMSSVKKVDIEIIGAGTAGMGAYREVLKHTDSMISITLE